MRCLLFIFFVMGGGFPINAQVCQSSMVSGITKQKLLADIIEYKPEEKGNPFFGLYEYLDSSTVIMNVIEADLDWDRFSFKKNALNFIEFRAQSNLWLIRNFNGKDSLFAVIEKNGAYKYSISTPNNQDKIFFESFRTSKIDANEACLVSIAHLNHLMGIVNKKIFVIDNRELYNFNEYYMSKYKNLKAFKKSIEIPIR